MHRDIPAALLVCSLWLLWNNNTLLACSGFSLHARRLPDMIITHTHVYVCTYIHMQFVRQRCLLKRKDRPHLRLFQTEIPFFFPFFPTSDQIISQSQLISSMYRIVCYRVTLVILVSKHFTVEYILLWASFYSVEYLSQTLFLYRKGWCMYRSSREVEYSMVRFVKCLFMKGTTLRT